MMTDLLIRKACTDDIASIVTLIAPFVDQFAISDEGRRRFTIDGIQQILKRDGIQYFIAEMDHHPIGVIAYLKPSHLVHFFIDQAYQGKGIGRKLWNHIESLALQENISEFTVNSNCNAQGMYEHLGFIQTEAVVEHAGLRFVPMKKSYLIV